MLNPTRPAPKLMCPRSFLFSLQQFFKISPILLTSSTFLFVIAQTFAQNKCLRDCDTCIFYCHMTALAGDTRLRIFLMEVEWLFLFLASSKGLRAFNWLVYTRTTIAFLSFYQDVHIVKSNCAISLGNTIVVFDFLPIYVALYFLLQLPIFLKLLGV